MEARIFGFSGEWRHYGGAPDRIATAQAAAQVSLALQRFFIGGSSDAISANDHHFYSTVKKKKKQKCIQRMKKPQ